MDTQMTVDKTPAAASRRPRSVCIKIGLHVERQDREKVDVIVPAMPEPNKVKLLRLTCVLRR